MRVPNWLEIQNTAGLLFSLPKISTLYVFSHSYDLALKVVSSFNLISVCFSVTPTLIGFLSSDMATATPLSGSCPLAEENHSVLLQQLFMLACVHPLYMNTWAAFVSLLLYQVTRHGCAVCLMEMLCRKRPCGSLEYMYIRNGILVSSPWSNCLPY